MLMHMTISSKHYLLNRDLKIVVYGKRLTPDTLLAIKIKLEIVHTKTAPADYGVLLLRVIIPFMVYNFCILERETLRTFTTDKVRVSN